MRRAPAEIRELEPDHVLIPSADGLVDVLAAQAIVGVRAVPPGLEVEGLLLRGSFAYRGDGPLGRLRRRLLLALRSRAPLSRIHHLDPILEGGLWRLLLEGRHRRREEQGGQAGCTDQAGLRA